MIEKKLFTEIPAGTFHSCVLTTYSFDFYFFQERVMHLLRAREVENVCVLADTGMLNNYLGQLTGSLDTLGKTYSLSGIRAKGVFHPKINLFLGYEEALVLIGSGNLTACGHGKNHELWGAFYIVGKDDPQLPLLHQVWGYLMQYGEQLDGIARKKMDWCQGHCSLLSDIRPTGPLPVKFHPLDYQVDAAFLGSLPDSPVLNQLFGLVPVEEVHTITILSPFFDSDGKALRAIAEHFEKAQIRVLIEEGYGNLPVAMPGRGNVAFYRWESPDGSIRVMQHAKFIHFATAKAEYCLFGSANITTAALGTRQERGDNEEAGILLKRTGGDYLRDLGIICTGEPREVTTFRNARRVVEASARPAGKGVTLAAVDRHRDALEVYIRQAFLPASTALRLYGFGGEVLHEIMIPGGPGRPIILTLPAEMTDAVPVYAELADTATGRVLSNRQIVHDKEALLRKNPFAESRRLAILLSRMESGFGDPFELLDFYNTIQANKPAAAAKTVDVADAELGITPFGRKPAEEAAAALPYDEAVERIAGSSGEEARNFQEHYHTVKILEMLYQLQEGETDNRLAPDAGDQDEGEDQQENDTPPQPPLPGNAKSRSWTTREMKRQRNKFFVFLDNYWSSLEKRKAQKDQKIGLVDLSMFLIALHLLIDLAEHPISRDEEEKQDEKQPEKPKLESRPAVWLPKSGKYEDNDSFAPLALQTIGKFLLACGAIDGFRREKDPYSEAKQKYFVQKAFVKTIFCLTAIHQSTPTNAEQAGNWISLLYFNLRFYFPPVPGLALKRELQKLVPSCWRHYSLERGMYLIEGCEGAFAQYNLFGSGQDSTSKGALSMVDSIGICSIHYHVPNKLGRVTEFLKLCHPGFSYSAESKEFLVPHLYSIINRRFFPGKNELQQRK